MPQPQRRTPLTTVPPWNTNVAVLVPAGDVPQLRVTLMEALARIDAAIKYYEDTIAKTDAETEAIKAKPLSAHHIDSEFVADSYKLASNIEYVSELMTSKAAREVERGVLAALLNQLKVR